MKFCSTEARKIIKLIDLDERDWFDLEVALLSFFPNHIVSVIQGIQKRGRTSDRWEYWERPVVSMLSARTQAHRPDDPEIIADEHTRRVYDTVTGRYLRTDIGRSETIELVSVIPELATETNSLLRAMRASSDRDVRSISYLRAILSREDQSRRSRIREILDDYGDEGWSPPDDAGVDMVAQRLAPMNWEEARINAAIRKRLSGK